MPRGKAVIGEEIVTMQGEAAVRLVRLLKRQSSAMPSQRLLAEALFRQAFW